MKKLIIIGISAIVFIIVGINTFKENNEEYYESISNLVVAFYKSDKYDEDKVKKKDVSAVEKYLSKLTHKNEEIDLSEYIEESKVYFTTEHNTHGVYTKDGKCFIEYEDLGFAEMEVEKMEHIEPYKKVVCDNYFADIYASYFYPSYEVTKKDPKYNYLYDSMTKKEHEYIYKYISTYDGSGLLVKLSLDGNVISKIDTEYINKGDV